MFGWFRRATPPPKPSPANPGRGHKLRIGFANASRNWEESANLVTCLAETLRDSGYAPSVGSDSIELEGFALQPQIVSFQPLEPSGVSTATTIEVTHPSLGRSTFEYQHSSGDSLVDSLKKGFKDWAELDMPVYLDALRTKPEVCTFLEMSLPPAPGRPVALQRRIVLGPTVHMAKEACATQDPHPFCPCCLYTNSHEAFKQLLESDGFHGIRFFVLRGADGQVRADCRVNGEDWPAGVEALVRYGDSWAQRGFEFRKQYVCIQTVSRTQAGA